MAQTFLENPENKPQVNHKNGIRSDNTLSNLEWCTQSENIIHSYKELGRMKTLVRKKGADHFMYGKLGYLSKKSRHIQQFSVDGVYLRDFANAYEIQRELGICQQNVAKVANGDRKSAGGFIWKFKNQIT